MGDFNVDFCKQNCSLYKNYKDIFDLFNLNQLIKTVVRLTDASSTNLGLSKWKSKFLLSDNPTVSKITWKTWIINWKSKIFDV